MALKRKIIAERIVQIREDIPGTCIHKQAENIIRGYDCEYLNVSRSEDEPIICMLHKRETTPNCFCCWAKRRPYPKNYWRGKGFISISQ